MSVKSLSERGMVTPGERSIILGNNKTWQRKQSKAIIFLHGSGDIAFDVYRDQNALVKGLAEIGTVHVGDVGFETWANMTGVERVHAIYLYLRAQYGAGVKVGLVGMSMGHAVACAYARLYPQNVAFIAGIIPLVDIRDAARFAQPGIDAAYATTKKIDYAWTGSANASPSTKTVPGGPVVTNHVWNSSFETNYLNWNPWGTSVSATSTRFATATARFGGFTNRCTFTAAGTTLATGQPSLAASPNSVPGDVWHAFAWIRSLVPITAQCRVGYFTRTGAVARGETQGPTVNVPANTWTPITASGTTPALADAVRPNLVIASRTWAINDWFEVDGVSQSKTLIDPNDYFSGSFADVFGFNSYVDGPLHNPAQFKLDPSIPHAMWCATSDVFTPIEAARAYKAANPEIEMAPGFPGDNIDAWGHTDAAVTISTPAMLAWIRKVYP